MKKNQSEKMTSNFIEVNGVGIVATLYGYQDVFVYGYFKMWNWWFIVHQDVETPQYVTVSEASTGRRLLNETYYNVEDALYFAVPFIKEKRYHFATTINNHLVKAKLSLLENNTSNLRTLALNML